MTKVTRRTLLGVAALAALRPFRGQTGMKFPTAPKARICVASYPFRAVINKPGGVDLRDFAGLVAERFDVHNIEPLDSHFQSTEPAYLDALRKAVAKAGSNVVNIPVSVKPSLADPSAEARKQAVANAKKWVDVAVVLNAPSIRTHILPVPGKPDAAAVTESLNELVDYSSFKGVVVNLENDDPRSEDPFFLASILKSMNHPYLRALPDFCNSRMIGDEDYNMRALTALFAYAWNVCHVKDEEAMGPKVLKVDLDKTFAIPKQAGYKGWLSMEFEGSGDPWVGTQKLIDATLRNLAA